jgi:hypothetical protein
VSIFAADEIKSIVLSAADELPSDQLRYEILSQPANGLVVFQYPDIHPSNSCRVICQITNRTHTGTDSFTFRAGDGALFSGAATVTLDVKTNASHSAWAGPVAANSKYGEGVGLRDATIATKLNWSCAWNSGQILGFTLVSAPAHGTLSYTPYRGGPALPLAAGADSFPWQCSNPNFFHHRSHRRHPLLALGCAAVRDASIPVSGDSCRGRERHWF